MFMLTKKLFKEIVVCSIGNKYMHSKNINYGNGSSLPNSLNVNQNDLRMPKIEKGYAKLNNI